MIDDHHESAELLIRRALDLSERRAANDQQLLPTLVLAITHALLSIDTALRKLEMKP